MSITKQRYIPGLYIIPMLRQTSENQADYIGNPYNVKVFGRKKIKGHEKDSENRLMSDAENHNLNNDYVI
jgi:hypothetical protein